MSEEHGGVICISGEVWRETFKDVLLVDSLTTQGVLREKGVYAEVRKRLLLPDTYTVHGIFYKWSIRQWEIVVEGPDLPALIEGIELPQVTPIYQRNADGSTSLVRIQEEPTGVILFDHVLTADEYAAEVKQRMEAKQ